MAGSPPSALPERLRTQVLAEWAPVVPLRAPWRRALLVTPVAALLAAVAAIYWGPQADWAAPGFAMTVTLSILQWTAGVAVLVLGLREAVPGRTAGRAASVIVGVGVVAMLVVNLAAKDAIAPAVVPVGRDWRFWTLCLRGPVMLALPVVLLAGVLAARAFPTRPARAGAWIGLAAGVLIDAGWRVGCHVTEASHVVGAHWLAVAASGIIGAAIVSLADTIRSRR